MESRRSVTSSVWGIRSMRARKSRTWHMFSRSTMTSTVVFPSGVVKNICRSPCSVLNRWSPRNPSSDRNSITSRLADATEAKSMSWSWRARCGYRGQSRRTACPPRSFSGTPRALAWVTTATA